MNSLQITEACNELSSNRKIYFCSKTAFLAQISLHSLCRVPQALRGFISKRDAFWHVACTPSSLCLIQN